MAVMIDRALVTFVSLLDAAERSSRGRRPEGVGLSDLFDALKRPTAIANPYQVCAWHMCSLGSLFPELLGKPDENSFGASDVAEPIGVFVLDHFADKLRTAFTKPGQRIVDVLHGEHDA